MVTLVNASSWRQVRSLLVPLLQAGARMVVPVFVMVCGSPLMAVQTPISQTEAPTITFDQTFFEFGKIPHEQTVSHRFRVANTGKAMLHLLEVKPSCGCTTTLVGKTALEPGESTEIEATFNPGRITGFVRKSILVFCDDPAHPKVTLRFSADILPAPPSETPVLEFHRVNRAGQARENVRLPLRDGKNLVINEIRLNEAAHLSVYPVSNEEGSSLDIVLDGARLPKNAMSGQNLLTVVTSDNPSITIPVTVRWDARPVIEADPPSVTWAETTGKAKPVTMVLRHLEDHTFRILGARTTSPVFQVVVPPQRSGPVQELQIRVAPGTVAGQYLDEHLEVDLDDPQQPLISIRISALIKD